MEVVVPAGTGLAAAACVYFGLDAYAHANLVKGKRACKDALEAAPGRLLALARRLGQKAPERLLHNHELYALLEEGRGLLAPKLRLLYDVDRQTLLGLLALASVGLAFLLMLLADAPLALPVGLAAPSFALLLRSKQRAKQQEGQLEGAMPEAFTALAMSLASGHSLAQALMFVGSHAEEPIKSEFLQVAHSSQCGIPLAQALDDMLARLRAPGLELVILALKVSRRTGAPLGELLGEASGMVGERIELKRKLDVKTSQARMSARLVASMPVTMIVALALLSGDFRRGLATPLGAVSIVVALVLNLVAWSIISRIMKVQL